jgi:hypothetical protein
MLRGDERPLLGRRLCPREWQVLKALLKSDSGSTKELAFMLGLTCGSTKAYMGIIGKKLGVRGRFALFKWALKERILEELPEGALPEITQARAWHEALSCVMSAGDELDRGLIQRLLDPWKPVGAAQAAAGTRKDGSE